jgi:hypothetical protein
MLKLCIWNTINFRSQHGSCHANFIAFEDSVWHKAPAAVAVLRPEIKICSVSLRSILIFSSHLPLYIQVGCCHPRILLPFWQWCHYTLSLFRDIVREVTLILISNFGRVLNVVCFFLGYSPASEFYMPTFRNTLFRLHRRLGVWRTPTRLGRWNRQSVPKRWHIKFRRWGITQKKAYNIVLVLPTQCACDL